MLSRVLVWVGLLSMVASGAGCGSSDGPGQVPEDDFTERLAAVYCGGLATCCDNANQPFDLDLCFTRVGANAAPPENPFELKFDPVAAGKCLEHAASSAQCGSFLVGGPCGDVWRGKVAVGQPCNSSSECARSVFEDARCVDKVCVSAPLAPRGRKGEPCSASCPSGRDCSRGYGGLDGLSDQTTVQAVCYADDGLYCAPSGCAEQVGKNDSCSGDDACRGATYCEPSSGECRERKPNGATCGGDRQCQSEHCAPSEFGGVGTCLPADEASAYECSFK